MDTFEKLAYHEGYKQIAGIDEAGRGPLAGPVVSAAVIFPVAYKNSKIKDSKKLSARQREELYDIIVSEAIAVGVGVADAEIIDRVNILQATFLTMREAVLELSTPPDFLLIDGLHCIPMQIPQKPLVQRRQPQCLHCRGIDYCQSITRQDYGNVPSPISPV
jgi:Ribonuclease HII